jgi:hypothetical protein
MARAFAAGMVRSYIRQLAGLLLHRLLDLSDTRRFEQLGTCPTYFQQYIASTNVSVQVVGKDVFAVEIISDATDYRRDAREMFPASVLEAITGKRRAVSKTLGLLAAGIDLSRQPAW